MMISIVTTLYRSEAHVHEFYERTVRTVTTITDDYEVIFVNDGSPDRSIDLAKELADRDSRVRVIDLSRNFGHHRALMTGLSHANGDYVFLIDSDLEEAPEELARFWTELTNREPGADVVFGVQARRRGSPFERASGWLFYSVINSFCDVKIPANFLTIRLMTRRYVDQLVNYDEREFVFAALTELVGFVKIPLVVSKAQTSPSTYDFGRKFSLVINTITSTSAKPLWFIFYFGLIITLTSFLSISYFVFRRLIWGVATDGWTSLIVSIWFFGGIFTLFLGIIGIYISRVYMETKKRPYVNIRDRYGWSTASGSELPSAVSQRHQQEERGTMAGVAHLKSKTAIMTSVKENAKL